MTRIPMNSQLPPYNLPVGTLINIDGRPHQRPTRTIPGRLAMLDCHTGQPFVVPDVKHGTALPTEDDYDDLLREGRLEIVLPENVVASRALAATASLTVVRSLMTATCVGVIRPRALAATVN